MLPCEKKKKKMIEHSITSFSWISFQAALFFFFLDIQSKCNDKPKIKQNMSQSNQNKKNNHIAIPSHHSIAKANEYINE